LDTAARILQTAVRVRSRDEDWTAVALVRQMALRHPRSHRTLDALMYAVQVPTAHSRWEIAEEILRLMATMLIGGFTVPVGRVLAVETVEYRVWTRHQVTATVRRRLQEYRHRAAGSAARVALRQQGEAIGDLDRALALNESIGRGDASDAWRSILLVREAELHLAAADLTSANDMTRHHRRAEEALNDVVRLERAHPTLTTDAVAYLKAHLSLALRTRDDDVAARHLADLHQVHRWPLHRSVPEVSAVAAGRRDPTVGPELRALVRHLVQVESGTSWKPAVSPANRNRRARAI
jgi:hypothetical protein